MINCADYIPEKCKADCCGPIPFPIDIFEKNKHLIKKEYLFSDEIENIPPQFFIFAKRMKGHVIPFTDDLTCVFLDDEYKCSIYDDRPVICKIYGECRELKCPHKRKWGLNELIYWKIPRSTRARTAI